MAKQSMVGIQRGQRFPGLGVLTAMTQKSDSKELSKADRSHHCHVSLIAFILWGCSQSRPLRNRKSKIIIFKDRDGFYPSLKGMTQLVSGIMWHYAVTCSEFLLSGQPNQSLGSRLWSPHTRAEIWRSSLSLAFLNLKSLPRSWALSLTLRLHMAPACQVNLGAMRSSFFWSFSWVLYQIMLEEHDLVRKSNYTWGENDFSKFCFLGK